VNKPLALGSDVAPLRPRIHFDVDVDISLRVEREVLRAEIARHRRQGKRANALKVAQRWGDAVDDELVAAASIM